MKSAIGCWLGLAGFLSAGNLTFVEESKEIAPGLEETKVSADFKFTNKTDKPVTIDKYDGGCSCVSVQIAGGKRVYAPGESGTLRANYDMGAASGTVEKTIMIWLDGASANEPSQSVKVRVNIPVLISIEPKTLKWEVGQPATAEKIQIKMNGDKPIHVLSVSSSNTNFTHELKTIEDGRHYELSLSPKDTQGAGLAVFQIKTDCEVQRHSLQQVFAVVRKTPAQAGVTK